MPVKGAAAAVLAPAAETVIMLSGIAVLADKPPQDDAQQRRCHSSAMSATCQLSASNSIQEEGNQWKWALDLM